MKYTVESSREWYNNLPGKRTSAGMIVRYRGRILMIKDDYKRAMTFPGGIIDPDEGAKLAALRETKEEAGLDIAPEDATFYSVGYMGEREGFKDCFHFFFIADIDEDTASQVQTEAGIEYHKWVNPNEIGELAGDRAIYNQLQTMLASGAEIPYFECK